MSEAAEVEDAVARGATVARRRPVVHTSVAEKGRLECTYGEGTWKLKNMS